MSIPRSPWSADAPVAAVRDARISTLSLQQPVGDAELGPLLAGGPEIALPGDGLPEILARLDARERRVIELRYGLDGNDPATPAETARRLRLNPRDVRHLETLALRKLRAAPEAAALAA